MGSNGGPRGPFSMVSQPPFEPRFPWLNGDLQPLRDTFRSDDLPPDQGQLLPFDVGTGDQLLAKVTCGLIPHQVQVTFGKKNALGPGVR